MANVLPSNLALVAVLVLAAAPASNPCTFSLHRPPWLLDSPAGLTNSMGPPPGVHLVLRGGGQSARRKKQKDEKKAALRQEYDIKERWKAVDAAPTAARAARRTVDGDAVSNVANGVKIETCELESMGIQGGAESTKRGAPSLPDLGEGCKDHMECDVEPTGGEDSDVVFLASDEFCVGEDGKDVFDASEEVNDERPDGQTSNRSEAMWPGKFHRHMHEIRSSLRHVCHLTSPGSCLDMQQCRKQKETMDTTSGR